MPENHSDWAVQLWDLTATVASLAVEDEDIASSSANIKPQAGVAPMQAHRHATEGFALDWSPVVAGQLASGDCASGLYVWTPLEAGRQVGAGLRSSCCIPKLVSLFGIAMANSWFGRWMHKLWLLYNLTLSRRKELHVHHSSWGLLRGLKAI